MVLLGAEMPAILAEVGFLSNPRDEKLLKTSAYRQKIAEHLYKGISRYSESLSHVTLAQKASSRHPGRGRFPKQPAGRETSQNQRVPAENRRTSLQRHLPLLREPQSRHPGAKSVVGISTQRLKTPSKAIRQPVSIRSQPFPLPGSFGWVPEQCVEHRAAFWPGRKRWSPDPSSLAAGSLANTSSGNTPRCRQGPHKWLLQ